MISPFKILTLTIYPYDLKFTQKKCNSRCKLPFLFSKFTTKRWIVLASKIDQLFSVIGISMIGVTVIGITMIWVTIIGITMIGVTMIGVTIIGISMIGISMIGITMVEINTTCQINVIRLDRLCKFQPERVFSFQAA